MKSYWRTFFPSTRNPPRNPRLNTPEPLILLTKTPIFNLLWCPKKPRALFSIGNL